MMIVAQSHIQSEAKQREVSQWFYPSSIFSKAPL